MTRLKSLSVLEPIDAENATQTSQSGTSTTISPVPEFDDDASTTSSNTESEPEPKPQDRLLEIHSTTDRGLAIFTTRKVKAGTLILAETPIISLSKAEENEPSAIEREFAQLLKAEQKAYLKLFDAHKSRMTRVVSIYYSNCYNCEGFKLDGTGGSVLGAMASRINHSCIPNVQFSYHETSNEMRFFAIRDIPRGKEVVSNYDKAVFDVAARRQRKQQMYYGFMCTCEACVPRNEFWERSDERRKGMYEAIRTAQGCEKRFADASGETRLVEREETVNEVLEALSRLEGLLLKECLVGVPLANVCRSMAKWAERKGDAAGEEVVKWKTRELEVCISSFGEDAQRTRDIQAKLR